MQVNTEVKGTLAKLLATENLNVEHRKITTAYFDTERRILALPIWKQVTGDVYDLLVGHEVGHALYTPNEDYSSAPKDFVNVLEDARVERKMKVTYPGLRKSFYKGYQELNTRDFFGTLSEDTSKLALIDRINLHFKVGLLDGVSIPFSEDELKWVELTEKTETFQDVVELAKQLYAEASKREEEKDSFPETPYNNSESGEETEEKEDKEYSPQSSNESGEESGESMTHEEMLEEAEKREQENEGGESFDETESITDKAWRDNQELLVDDNAKEWLYISTPEPILDSIIHSYKVVNHDLGAYFSEIESSNSYQWTMERYFKFKKSAQKSVNYLVKQFEMKKSADAYHRASTSRTGVLDTNKLHQYKYSEDLFKKVTIIPDGKNHGLIMHIDWSGSMAGCIMDTMKQLYNLIWFCRKVSIPFRVFAFVGGHKDNGLQVQKEEERVLRVDPTFKLFEFFSSKMSPRLLDEQMKLVWAQCYSVSSGFHHHGGHWFYGLGSTPLAEAVMCTPYIVKQFKREENIQKVNVICLTDGEANPLAARMTKYNEEDTYECGPVYRNRLLCHSMNKVWILRDRNSSYSKKINQNPYATTTEIVDFYRQITDYNWIGIRLCSKSELNNMLRRVFDYECPEMNVYLKQWAQNRFCKIEDRLGFSTMFTMPNSNFGGGTESIDVKQKGDAPTKAELQRAFKKHMSSKMTNKTLLNAFVEQIV